MKKILWACAVSTLFVAGVTHAQPDTRSAATFPTKPVRLVNGAPPGSGSDLISRLVAQKLAERWGQSVVVDNRPGAVGAIALDLASRAAPDGYTLLVGTGQNFTAMLLKRINIDIPKAFVPVVQLTWQPYLLVITPALPVNSVKELIAHAKSKPLVYASSGTGSVVHLGMELLKSMAGIEMVHVPYKGSGQSMIDVMSGRVQLAITNSVTATPLVKSGKIRALGVTTKQRAPAFPDLPTLSEAGLAGYSLESWYGLFAPAKTPEAIVRAINRDASAVTNLPDVKEKLAASAAQPAPPHSPAQFKSTIDQEIRQWQKFLSTTKLKLD